MTQQSEMPTLYGRASKLSNATQHPQCHVNSWIHDPQPPQKTTSVSEPGPHPASRAPCPGQLRYDHDCLYRRTLLTRNGTKPPNHLQHFTKHLPGHHYLGELEHKPPGMTHQPSACLDELRLNACKRPPLYRFWQSQSSKEVA